MAISSVIVKPIERAMDAARDAPALYMTLAVASATILVLLLRSSSKASPPIARLPLWLPLEIAATVYLVSAGGLVSKVFSLLRRNTGGLFGFSSKHQILYDLPEVDRIYADGRRLKTLPAGFTLLVRVFGGSTDPVFEEKLTKAYKALYTPVERVFLNEANATTALEQADIPGKTAQLVTLGQDVKTRKLWERSADCRPVALDAVEANLHDLLRDFGASIAMPMLYGQDFMNRYKTLLSDFWLFDNVVFPLRVVGAPSWLPMKAFQEGLKARERLLKEMRELYTRIDQYDRGESVDGGADMSDVSTIALERNKIYRAHDIEPWHRGEVDLTLLWGQNANTQPLVFWLIAYIYSTPGLLEELRKEIAPHVKVAKSEPCEITSLDIPALTRDCPLFKAALFEMYRLCNEATSIRYLSQAITFSEGGHTHTLPAGSFISAPHGVSQRDPTLYPSPEKFIPDRFLEIDEATGQRVARYGKLKPWGVGHGSCKGRSLAEREILAIVACVMSVWDIEPADGGDWKLPGMRPGTGAMCPLEDIRVVLRKREMLKRRVTS